MANRLNPIPCSANHFYSNQVAVWEKAAEKSGALKVMGAGIAAADPKEVVQAALVQKTAAGEKDEEPNKGKAAPPNAVGEKVAAGWATSKKATLKHDAAEKAPRKAAPLAEEAQAL